MLPYHAKTVKMATTRARAIAAREAPVAPETFDCHIPESASKVQYLLTMVMEDSSAT